MPQKRDFLSITDLTPEETLGIIRRARELKSADSNNSLGGKNLALLFEKPSLRTKTSFQVGIQKLGGYSIYLGKEEVGLGTREPISDVARVLSGYVDGIIARVNSHQALAELASYASVPVVNALSDWEHPCQILADLLTIEEHVGQLKGKKLAFIGDGNNVARSLCLGLPSVGASFAIAAPEGYNLDDATLEQARELGRTLKQVDSPSVEVLGLSDPREAVELADVVYTDVGPAWGKKKRPSNASRLSRVTQSTRT